MVTVYPKIRCVFVESVSALDQNNSENQQSIMF